MFVRQGLCSFKPRRQRTAGGSQGALVLAEMFPSVMPAHVGGSQEGWREGGRRQEAKKGEEGEKCTRYFFKKIINKGGGILKLCKENGCTVDTTEEIKNVVVEFYTSLYKEKPVLQDTINELINNVEKIVSDKVS